MAKTPTAMEATTSPVRVLSSQRSEETLLQRGVSARQPLWWGVVEIGQRALLQLLRCLLILRQDAVGITWHDFRLPHDQVGGVKPVLAQLIEPGRRRRDGLRSPIAGIAGGRNVGRKSFWEREGREHGGMRVARPILQV